MDRALAAAEPVDPRGVDVETDDRVVPGEEHGHGQADIAEAGDGDLRSHPVSLPYVPGASVAEDAMRSGREVTAPHGAGWWCGQLRSLESPVTTT